MGFIWTGHHQLYPEPLTTNCLPPGSHNFSAKTQRVSRDTVPGYPIFPIFL